jgi:hypothetical protein
MNILNYLQHVCLCTYFCAVLGIACQPLLKLGATTVHKQFGLRDGRYSPEQLRMLYRDYSDDYYAKR